jgi:hypothetical protein
VGGRASSRLDDPVPGPGNYLVQFDATTWGWIHLLVGSIVALAGWGPAVPGGRRLARLATTNVAQA